MATKKAAKKAAPKKVYSALTITYNGKTKTLGPKMVEKLEKQYDEAVASGKISAPNNSDVCIIWDKHGPQIKALGTILMIWPKIGKAAKILFQALDTNCDVE